jgi:glyoxylate utilization-related uncharacterized protein
MLTLQPGGGSGTSGMLHTGNEFAYCASGQVEYEVEGEKFILNPGDSLIFVAQQRHRWRNAGEGVAKLLIVLAGFQQSERPSEFHISSGKRGDAPLDEDELIDEAEALDLDQVDEEGAISEV